MAKRTLRVVGRDSVRYLRVSSKGQVDTDYNPEGISLPAQRAAVMKREHELGTHHVEEFVEPGRSGKTIDQRPEFQKMIAYLKANSNVGYVMVYALSRFARNRLDDAMMMATLDQLGVTLVSATERNIDDTPAGRMMHGMLAVINEYQVAQSGEDIKYKMGQKAKSGGTITRAKLGYKNVRIHHEGREMRTVEIDPDYAPWVQMAFELYATGEYGFRELRDALTDAGLRMPATRRHRRRPISIHKIGIMLRDRYYLGYVEYDGIEYPGRHHPLIDPELFDRVQRILYAERGAGTRQRHHEHYLKGTDWCGRCQRRLILRPSTSKTGRQYFYFICRGIQDHTCDLPALPVWKVEKAVEAHYTHVHITPADRATIERLATEAVHDSKETTAQLRKQLTTHLKELDTQEDRYLDLIGDSDWPQDKIKARIRRVREEQARIQHQLDNTGNELDTGRQLLLVGLDLLDDPHKLYQRATDRARKVLNQALFRRLHLDADGNSPTVAADHLTEPFTTILHATRDTTHTLTAQHIPIPRDGTPTQQDSTDRDLANLLRTALLGQSASKAMMVELRGIEPLTFSMRTRRATNCATAPRRARRV